MELERANPNGMDNRGALCDPSTSASALLIHTAQTGPGTVAFTPPSELALSGQLASVTEQGRKMSLAGSE